MGVVTSGSDVMGCGISILMTSRRAKTGSVNGKFIQRRGYELAAERYHEPHLKLLQDDIHRY